mgnify:CR=1 FL=1
MMPMLPLNLPGLFMAIREKNPAERNLIFLIQYHFGQLKSGIYELFGLDQATNRLGLEYGIYDHIMVGIGCSTWEKTYDGFI